MSLASSPEYMPRAEDKALKMLFPFAEGPINNVFDEYFDCEYLSMSNDGDEKYTSPQDDLFTWGIADGHTQSRTNPADVKESAQPWRAGLWCLNGKQEAEPILDDFRRTSQCAQDFILPAHLVSNENCAVRASPSGTMNTKNDLSRPKTAIRHHRQLTHIPITRERTLSPTPTYANFPARGEMAHDEKWQKDFQDFHLHAPTDGRHLYQQNGPKPVRHNLVLRQVNSEASTRSATSARSSRSPTRYHYPFNHVTRQNEEYLEASVAEHLTSEPNTGTISGQMEQLGDVIYPRTKSDRYAAPVWTTESLHSSDSSHYSHGSHYSNDNRPHHTTNFGTYDTTSPLLANTGALAFPDQQLQTTVSVPRSVNHQSLRQQYQGGLGIHCPSADQIGRAVSYGQLEPHQLQQDAVSSSSPLHTMSNSFTSYPPLPPLPTQTIPDLSPLQTPRRLRRSPSCSLSPPVSPTQLPSSRSLRQRSPARAESSHPRRKSIHKPGPIREVSHHDKERRTRSSSRPPRTPRTPKTPKTPTSAGFANLDFVNFTPRDSEKLMSDVAPSGSSKTRARREQEAKEKRKKLSEAALQAVRRAGGDVSALEEAIYI